ncbi:MAG: elongation factor Ts [Candidatus Omnitrophica bacterium]|nr:elongation factor Ts [Candidatus Omnitrophota bacterium]
MNIPLNSVKELRKSTSASIADCRKALEESKGDMAKAAEWLRKHGLEMAAKKEGRHTKEGRVESYVHTGSKVGTLLEVGCETDFVARNEDFCRFAKDLAMQITACNPRYIKKEDVPEDIIKNEKDKEQFYKEHCLLEQPFIKDSSINIKDYLGSIVSKVGENIVVRKFIRYKIGE